MQDYHSARVLPIVYEPVVLTVTAILTYYEATLNTRKRIISGFLLVFMSNAAIKAVSSHLLLYVIIHQAVSSFCL